MVVKLAALWFVLFFLVTGSFAQIACPPLDKERAFYDYSQADADKLKQCSTFHGNLYIWPRNQSSPIILDGLIHIAGTLDARAPFEFKTLVSVYNGDISVGRNFDEDLNITTLEFPVLKSVRSLWIVGLNHVETINFPSLETVTWILNIRILPSLRNINIPQIRDLGSLGLEELPSLKIFSFGPYLKSVGGLSIRYTSLTSIEGLNFHKTSTLHIRDNKDPTTLTFPFLKVIIPEKPLQTAEIYMQNNSDNLYLNLPRLKGIQGNMMLSGFAAVNIPELTYIDEELCVGANTFWDFQCRNCYPTPALTNLTAPKLIRVFAYINFDSSPALTSMSFLALRYVGGIAVNNTAAANLPNGIFMPLFKRACNAQIIGTAPNCTSFDAQHNRRVVMEDYFCGANKTEHMHFISESCAKRIKSWRELLLDYCDSLQPAGCTYGYILREDFKVKFAPIIIALVLLFLYVVRKLYIAVKLSKARWLAEGEVKTARTEPGAEEVTNRLLRMGTNVGSGGRYGTMNGVPAIEAT